MNTDNMLHKEQLVVIWADDWPHAWMFGVYRVQTEFDIMRHATEYKDLDTWDNTDRISFIEMLEGEGLLTKVDTVEFYLGGPVNTPQFIGA